MESPRALTADEIKKSLSKLEGWSGDTNGLKKTLVFETFLGCMKYMNACVEGIEKRDHHPVWINKYNSLDINLDTFDVGHKITQKDIDLALHFEEVLQRLGRDCGYMKEDR